jgi:putative tricarboxylic transport membrane protein
MNRRIDLAGAVGVCLLGAFVLVHSLTAPTPSVQNDAIGVWGFPMFLGGLLAVLGLTQSIRTFRDLRATGPIGIPEGTEDEEGHESSGLRALGFMAGLLLYLALLKPVGFVIMTPIAIYVSLWAMQMKGWVKRTIFAVAFTVLAFFCFAEIVGVPLPVGPLTDLFLELGLIDYR